MTMAKILVVDDEMQVRELLRDALSMKGYSVITVPTAPQALETILNEPFDLILLDVKLGNESGITILQKVRQLHARIPVVIYSGAVTAELEKEARSAGANEVLNKNMGIAELVGQIGRIMRAKERIFQGQHQRKDVTVLIVDDEPEVRHVLKDFFKKKGYRALEAESGKRALEIVRSEKVSAVLLDIRMPEMDGLTALEELLKIDPKLGVIMVTAGQDDENIKKALRLGACSYVLKPLDFLYLELTVMSKLAIAQSD